jgi:hypothetical protein
MTAFAASQGGKIELEKTSNSKRIQYMGRFSGVDAVPGILVDGIS